MLSGGSSRLVEGAVHLEMRLANIDSLQCVRLTLHTTLEQCTQRDIVRGNQQYMVLYHISLDGRTRHHIGLLQE